MQREAQNVARQTTRSIQRERSEQNKAYEKNIVNISNVSSSRSRKRVGRTGAG